jgi:hypothetical protein
MCCAALPSNTAVIGAGSTPFIVAASVMSYEDLAELTQGTPPYRADVTAACVLGFCIYAAATVALAAVCINNFDKLIDRPRHEWPLATAAD